MKKEKTIILKSIKKNVQTLDKAIGVKEEEIRNCVRQINTECSKNSKFSRSKLQKSLGLREEEIFKVAKKFRIEGWRIGNKILILPPPLWPDAVDIWENRGRTEVTLKEFIGTIMLIILRINDLQKEKKNIRITQKDIKTKRITDFD